jgi:alkanesulfonate monooxygenase SsuD/methylene tetrahydromethanopterin reductase-like flavin-dependent oxidoreductase (luciferase family)
MREMVALCRAMWSGDHAPTTKVIPSSEMGLSFAVEGPIPILVAGGGRQMLALAAEIADIVHVASPFLGPAYLSEVIDHIHASAASAGRARDDYEVDITVPLSVLPDGKRAKRLAKVSAAMGISWMAERAKAAPAGAPLPPEFAPAAHLVDPITTAWRSLGDSPLPDEIADLIDESVLRNFSIAGTSDECRDGLVALVRELPGITGVRVKLPSLTGDDAPEVYAAMVGELGAMVPAISAARVTTSSS